MVSAGGLAPAAKGHWEAAKPLAHRHLWIGVPTTVCAAGTGVSAFSNPPIVTGVLAVVVAVGSGLNTFPNPNERHRRHRDAGNAYRALNNHAQIFRTTECVAVATYRSFGPNCRNSISAGTT